MATYCGQIHDSFVNSLKTIIAKYKGTQITFKESNTKICMHLEFVVNEYVSILSLSREVQQFCEEVRNSPEVKLAVQAFAAVNSNNFVRFFKLVKRASYLVSCLLHRYFNQVSSRFVFLKVNQYIVLYQLL